MTTSFKYLLATSLLLAPALAAAQGEAETADSAMKRGKAAQKAGRIHEACEAFAASDKLAASVDAELALASCYEQDGKPMSAARVYHAAADKDGDAARAKTSLAKAQKLELRAAKLRLTLSQSPAGLVVKVDGETIDPTKDVLVDTGPHEVVATAPGFEGKASAPVDREKAIVDVIVRLHDVPKEPEPARAPALEEPPADKPAPAAAPMAEPAEPKHAEPMAASSGDHRMRNGIIVGAIGVGAVVASGILFAGSSSKFDDEHALCPMSRCADDATLAQANSLLSDARTMRGLSYGIGIAGIAAIGVGAYLVLTHHEEAPRMTVQVDQHGAGVAYTAKF